ACVAGGVARRAEHAGPDSVPVADLVTVAETVPTWVLAELTELALLTGRTSPICVADLGRDDYTVAAFREAAPTTERALIADAAAARNGSRIADLGAGDLSVATHARLLTIHRRLERDGLRLDGRRRLRAGELEAIGWVLAVILAAAEQSGT